MNYVLKSSEYVIVATGEYSNFSIPVDLTEQLEKFQKLLGHDEIENQLNPSRSDTKPDSKTDEKGKSISAELAEVEARTASIALAIKLGSYLREGYPAELIRDINSCSSFWEFTVDNKGNREVTDLKLELPFDGYYRIDRSGVSPQASKFTKNIPCGSLRPANTIKIVVWAKYPNLLIDAERTRLTYPNGIAEISYPTKVTGVLAWLYRNTYILFVMVFGGGLMAAQIVLQKYIEKGDKQRRQLASDKALTLEESIKKLQEIIEGRPQPAQLAVQARDVKELAIQAPGAEVEETAADKDNGRVEETAIDNDRSPGDKENRAIAETVGDIPERTLTRKDLVD